ncbi:hypothetical protein G7Y89_g15395 [Cudoniella acicularis]|uniref:Enoyl reductase (ER) domain-containing protein n=1 Tax=Cudoniella acicularis TaxID=354080 RepID=A0A8H4QNE4_9HELO|nr:hypothetical protein G7Y89_g15395 [Cudoniella acicularis]
MESAKVSRANSKMAIRVQKGAWLETPGPGARVAIRDDIPVPTPSEGEVLVKLECTGVCHSDVYNILGHLPMTTHIAGHEGVGRIVEGKNSHWSRRIVVFAAEAGRNQVHLRVNNGLGGQPADRNRWLQNYCGKCEICAEDVTACPSQNNSGRDVPGTFQQYAVSPVEPLTMIPDGLDSMIAAPLLCVYSAIRKVDPKPGQWLVLPGAGGGLGHIAVQIAHRKGLKVIAIDTGEEKRKLCMDLGATSFLDFKTDDVLAEVKKLTNGYGAHAAICLSASRAGYEQSLSLLRSAGILVCIGLGKDDVPISPFMMIVRGLRIVGSSVGNKEEMSELLEMAARGEVVPMTKTYELEELNEVLKLVEQNKIAGRAVVRIP